jgi:tol-pal system protein YbgF
MQAEYRPAVIKSRIVLAAIVLIGCLTGCATNTVHEMNALQQNISMLYERVQALERRIDSSDGQSQKKADFYARLDELQLKVRALDGKIDETDHKIDQLARASASGSSSAAPVVSPSPATPSITPAPSAATPSPAPPSVAKTTSTPQPNITIPEKEDPEKALFAKASQAFQQGQYDTARKDYQGFLSKYPKSQQADDALFSIGECYFSEKRYQDAVEVYQQVIERYPKGSKMPQALFKQGTAFQQMGDATAARILYERLVEKYPDSPQAQAAQKKLKQLQ